LIVRRPFPSINGIHFHIDQKELTPELLFEVGLGLNGKNASICLLIKEVLGPPCSPSILEKGKGPEDFFLITAEPL